MDGYVHYIASGVESLKSAGAEFIVMTANSPHSVFDIVQKKTEIPMISIVDVTAKEAKRLGMRKLLLTGIKYTMQSPFYKDVFTKYGMDVIIPSEEEQEEINRIIFDELVIGVFREETRKSLLAIINSYEEDGVILGCTELPLILNQEDTEVRLLNTLEIHAQAALDFALAE
jgi:aspartate racemase